MKESDIQSAIVDFCRAVLPPPAMVFAIPNASRRTRTGRAGNAVAGLMPGASDLVVLTPRVSIFAEVKAPRGKVRPEQVEFAQRVRALGHHAAIWRGIDDVRDTFMALQIRTREALQ